MMLFAVKSLRTKTIGVSSNETHLCQLPNLIMPSALSLDKHCTAQTGSKHFDKRIYIHMSELNGARAD